MNEQDQAKRMENEALQALLSYITTASPLVNRDLRAGKKPAEVKRLDSLFEPMAHELTVYRALPISYVNIEKDLYYDPAYLSTSKSIDYVLPKFAEGSTVALLIITLPKGTKVIDVRSLFPDQNDEDEIILMKGCHYHVGSKNTYTKEGNPTISDFEKKYEGLLTEKLFDIEHVEEYYLYPQDDEKNN